MKKKFRRGLAVLMAAALTLGNLNITADTVAAAETAGAELLGIEELGIEQLGAEELGTEELETEELGTEQLEIEALETDELETEDLSKESSQQTGVILPEVEDTEDSTGAVLIGEYGLPIFSGKMKNPTKVTEDNYTMYGFTEENYTSYLGYHAITCADEMFAFAAMVSGGTEKVNAVLINDIDLAGKEWTPIGVRGHGYKGNFDGQGHRIYNLWIEALESTDEKQGFFGNYDEGTLSNLIIDKSCTIKSGGYSASGLVASAGSSSAPLIIKNCVNEATVTGLSSVGGIAGSSDSDGDCVYITDCYNTGTITATVGKRPYGVGTSGAIIGFGGRGTVITNCYNTGTIVGAAAGYSFAGYYYYFCTLINCYQLDTLEAQENVTEFTAEEASNGTLCYLLNEQKEEGTVWYQKLDGAETLPNLMASEDRKVYAEYEHGAAAPTGYHNTRIGHTVSNEVSRHETSVGRDLKCSVCGIIISEPFIFEAQDIEANIEYEEPLTLSAELVTSDTANVANVKWNRVTIGESGETLEELATVSNLSEIQYKIPQGLSAGVYTYALTATDLAGTYTYRKDIKVTISKFTLKAEDFEVTIPDAEELYYSGNVKTAVVRADESLTGAGSVSVKYKKDNKGAFLDEAVLAGTYQVYALVEEGERYQAAELNLGVNFTITAEVITKETPIKVTADNYKTYDFTDENYSEYIGYYAITSAAELFGFAEIVNSEQDTAAKGVLINNITIPKHQYWTPIGSNEIEYRGIVDGLGHTISNLVIDTKESRQGLVGTASEACIIRNLILDETCSIKGEQYIGAFIGYVHNLTELQIEHCVNLASVTGTYHTSAMIGCVDSSGSPKFINCYSAGMVTGLSSAKFSDRGVYTNCYQMDNVNVQSRIKSFTKEMAESGELCYLLNGEQAAGTVWYQKLGTNSEKWPGLSADKDKLVYEEYDHGAETASYTNKVEKHLTANIGGLHNDYIGEDFKCLVCGLETSMYITSEEAVKNVNIEYAKSQAILSADIVLDEHTTLDTVKWYKVKDDTRELDFDLDRDVTDFTNLEDIQFQLAIGKAIGTHRYALIATDSNGYAFRKDFAFVVNGLSLKAADFQVTWNENPYYSGNAKKAVVKLAAELNGVGEITAKYKKDNTGELLDEMIEVGTYRVYAAVTQGTRYAAAEVDTGTDVEITRLDVAEKPEKVTPANYESYHFIDETGSKYVGYYAITSVEEMYGFAELVNSGTEQAAKGVLTCDIDMPEGYYWTPIGTEENCFSGTFDGQGHTISKLIIDTRSDNQALIGHGTTETIVCSLTLDKTCSITGGSYVAGFVATISEVNSSNWCTIKNCGNNADITGTDKVGGLFGTANTAAATTIQMQNCYNTGLITAVSGSYAGGMCAGGYNFETIENSYNTGKVMVSGREDTSPFAYSGTYTNCYQLESVGYNVTVVSVTSEEVANGALCYMLNNSKSGATNWYQKLGIEGDANPTIVADTDRLVYAEYAHGSDEVSAYANTAKNHTEPNSSKAHDDYFGSDFRCLECGEETSLYILAENKEADILYPAKVPLLAEIYIKDDTIQTVSWYEVLDGYLDNQQIVEDFSDLKNIQYQVATGKPAGIYTYALVVETDAGATCRKDVTFTVNKMKVTKEDLEVTLPENMNYSGNFKRASIKLSESITDYGTVNVKYLDNSTGEMDILARDPGTYEVYAEVTGGNRYSAALVDTGVSFTITDKTYEKTIPEQITEKNYRAYGFEPDNYTAYLGYYGIRTSAELFGFAELTNGTEETAAAADINGVMVSDIELEENQYWTSIGENKESAYYGIFDGLGHTISNLQIDAHDLCRAFVNYAAPGITICNLTLDETCSISLDGSYAAGFIGSALKDGRYTLRNCGNRATIYASEGYAAGLAANIVRGTFLYENCYNAGTIKGLTGISGISMGKRNQTFINCYNVGNTTYKKVCESFARSGTYINCYQLDSVGVQENISIITQEDLENGALCYLLNGSKQAGDTWYQKLGDDADAIPVTVAAKDKLVYAEFKHGEDEVIAYHNTQTGHTLPALEEAHNDYVGTDLICSKCKEQLPIGITVNDTSLPYSDLRTGKLTPEIGVKEGTSITSAVWYEVDGDNKKMVADVTDKADKAYEVPAGKAQGTYTYLLELTSSEEDFTVEKSMSLTITNGEPTVADFTVTLPIDVKYNQNAKTAAITTKSGVTGMGAIAVKYKKDNAGILLDTAGNVGTYQVYAVVAAGSNYDAAIVDTGASFTISYIAVPTNLLYNGKSKASSYVTTNSVAVSAAGYTVSAAADGGFAAAYNLSSSKAGTLTKTLYFKDSAGHISAAATVSVVFQTPTAVQLPKKGATVKIGKAVYKVTASSAKKGTVTYVKPTSKKLTSIVIPDSVKIKGVTFKVTAIAANACKSNTKLAKVTIGKNVKTIGKNAFLGCKKLKKITVKTKNLTTKSVGKNALKNIYAKAVISVPKAKVKAYTTLLKKKGIGKNCKVKKA